MTGGGTLDIGLWPTPQTLRASPLSGVSGSGGLIIAGFQRAHPQDEDVYFGIAIDGTGGFGGRSFLPATRSSGDPFALALLSGAAYLPAGYRSGQPLQALAEWDRASLQSMGLIQGRFRYSWSTARGRDQVDVLTGPQPVPGPAPLLGGALALGSLRRWRQRCRTRCPEQVAFALEKTAKIKRAQRFLKNHLVVVSWSLGLACGCLGCVSRSGPASRRSPVPPTPAISLLLGLNLTNQDIIFLLTQLRLPGNLPLLPIDPTGIRDVRGIGNNLNNPTWGAAQQPFTRDTYKAFTFNRTLAQAAALQATTGSTNLPLWTQTIAGVVLRGGVTRGRSTGHAPPAPAASPLASACWPPAPSCVAAAP